MYLLVMEDARAQSRDLETYTASLKPYDGDRDGAESGSGLPNSREHCYWRTLFPLQVAEEGTTIRPR